MKNRVILLLCVVMSFPTVAVAQRMSRRKPTPTSPVQQVKQTIEHLTRAWAANQPDQLRLLCAEDIVVVDSGRRFRGLQTVLEYLQFSFKNFPEMEIQLGSLEARVVGSMAWAHAESRVTQVASGGLKLTLAGYSSYVLERQRTGWKCVLMDFDLRPTEPIADATPPQATPHVIGAWALQSCTNLSQGSVRRLTAVLILTTSYYCWLIAASDRRPPKDENKSLADYSRKEWQELVRDFDAGAGIYRWEGDKLILSPALTFRPNQVGQDVMLEKVTVTRSQLSYQTVTPEGQFQWVWQRIQ